jgi:hypothetical protein
MALMSVPNLGKMFPLKGVFGFQNFLFTFEPPGFPGSSDVQQQSYALNGPANAGGLIMINGIAFGHPNAAGQSANYPIGLLMADVSFPSESDYSSLICKVQLEGGH